MKHNNSLKIPVIFSKFLSWVRELKTETLSFVNSSFEIRFSSTTYSDFFTMKIDFSCFSNYRCRISHRVKPRGPPDFYVTLIATKWELKIAKVNQRGIKKSNTWLRKYSSSSTTNKIQSLTANSSTLCLGSLCFPQRLKCSVKPCFGLEGFLGCPVLLMGLYCHPAQCRICEPFVSRDDFLVWFAEMKFSYNCLF